MESNSITMDDTNDHDLLAQVMGDKCKANTKFGLGSLESAKSSHMLIVKEALLAKANAEDREKKMQEEMKKVIEQQQKIISFLQQSNPHMNLNEISSLPN
ncbi:hypothetical protein LINGRAHAP2_LOCUS23991 [Linum grandiflorum]